MQRHPGDRAAVLAVTSEPPWPLDSGGHLRSFHVMRMLASRFDLRLVTPVRGTSAEAAGEALRAHDIEARFVALPRRTPAAEAVRAAACALRGEPYVMFGRHRSAHVARALRDELRRRRADVVYLDHLDSLVYDAVAGSAPIVVDMHNVYSRLAGRAANEATGHLRRAYLARETALLARMEQRAAAIADTILAVSDDDADYFRKLGARRVVVVPNGVDCAAYASGPIEKRRCNRPTILYVGALSWLPNASAARYLITDVLPMVRKRLADARVVVVGRNPPADLVALANRTEGAELAADVPDVTPYFRAADVLAVPLETGGGTRLKILEAFATGLPVVSTAIGCEGIAGEHGRDLVVAERPHFAAAIAELLLDPPLAGALAASAKTLALERYDWSVVGATACAAVEAAGTRRPAPDRIPAALAVERA